MANVKIIFVAIALVAIAAILAGCSGPAANPTPKPGIHTPAVTLQPSDLSSIHRNDIGIVVPFNDKSITDTASLSGKRVAAVGVDAPGAQQYGITAAMNALYDGKVDAVVGDYNALYEYVRANPLLYKFAPNMYGG